MTATTLPLAATMTDSARTEAQFKTDLTNLRAALAEMGDPLGKYGAIQNLSLSCSVAASALTIAVKDRAGSDASATSPASIPFRNVTAATGNFSVLNVTAAASLTISSGSTMGTSNSTPFRLWIVGFNDGGTFRIGAVNCLSGTSILALRDHLMLSSTAEGGAGGADSAQVIYTGTAVTSKAMRILGYLDYASGLATAGTWSSAPSTVQLFGPGVPLPGDVIQIQRNASGSVATGTTTLPVDDTIPQNTEGDQYMTQAITPTGAMNLLEVEHLGMYSHSASPRVGVALFQDSTANALAASVCSASAADIPDEAVVRYAMRAATTSSTTFKVRAGASGAGTTTFNGLGGGRIFAGVMGSYLQATERMG